MQTPHSHEFNHAAPADPDDQPFTIDLTEVEPGIFGVEGETAAAPSPDVGAQPRQADAEAEEAGKGIPQANRPAGERTDWRRPTGQSRAAAGDTAAGKTADTAGASRGKQSANASVNVPKPNEVFGGKPKAGVSGSQEPKTGSSKEKAAPKTGPQRNDYRETLDEKAARRARQAAERAARSAGKGKTGQAKKSQHNQQSGSDNSIDDERAAKKQAAKERAAQRAAEAAAAQAAAEQAKQPGKAVAVLGAAALGPVVLGNDVPRVHPGAEWRYANEPGSEGGHERGEQNHARNEYLEQQIRFLFVPGSERWKAFFGNNIAPGYVDVDDLTPPPPAPRHPQVGQRKTPALEPAGSRGPSDPKVPGPATSSSSPEADVQAETRGRSPRPQEFIKRLGGKIISFAAEKAATGETEITDSQPESVRRRIANLLGKLASKNSALEASPVEPTEASEATSPVKELTYEQSLKDALRKRNEAQAAYDAIVDDDNISSEAKMDAGARLMEAREYYDSLMWGDAEAFQQFMRERQRRDEDGQS